MTTSQIAGILPAIVFPAATAAQLIQIVRTRSTAGVSASTWVLFGFANIAMYVYAERFTEWQAIVGMLLTSILDFAIAAMAWAGVGSRLVRTGVDQNRRSQRVRIVSQEPPSPLGASHP
jgi:uncharacterized protein with PQ loop repeat